MSAQVLVVDDDPDLVQTLADNFEARGYRTVVAGSGEEALARATEDPPDLVILDLGLPGIDGVEVIHRLRGWFTGTILVLSARGAEADKVDALDAGADDYVSKPFGMAEVLARVRAALRRPTPDDADQTVRTAHFTIDLPAHRVERDGEEVRLTRTEWRIIEELSRQRGRLVGRTQLLQRVWGPEYTTESHYLRVYLAALRRKLEPDPSRPRYLLTEPGLGYRFVVD